MATRSKFSGAPLYFVVVFALLAGGISAAGRRYYADQKEYIRLQKQADLAAIANMKADEISAWNRERLGDAKLITKDPFLLERVRELLDHPDDSKLLGQVLAWMRSLKETHGYMSVLLTDVNGSMRFSTDDVEQLCPDMASVGSAAISSRSPIFIDLHRFGASTDIHLYFIVPILNFQDPDTSPVGVIYLRMDPHKFLFPLIQTWPVSSRSAETLLVRREGDQVLFLNELRHRKGTSLSLGFPINEERLPAAMAARGQEGVVDGLDYRGMPVLAAIRAVPDSPWFIVAKVDVEEIDAPVREKAWFAALAAGFWIATAGLAMALVWRKQSMHYYVRRYEMERERLELAERYEFLTKYANDIILLIDYEGKIVEANDSAAQVYGYEHDELTQLNVRALRDPTTLGDVGAQMRQAEEQGVIFETLHLRKDGGAFPVEVSSRVIVIGERKFFLSIIRDISERRKSEQRISHLNRLYAFLSQINQAVVYTRDRDHLLKEACRIAVEYGSFAKAWIAMVNRETNVITMAAHSGCDETAFKDIHLVVDEQAVSDPVECALFRDGKSLIICNDVENDSEVNALRKEAIGLGCRAFASVPLRLGGTMIGLFNVCTNEVNLFDAEIIRLLEEIAGDISFALDLMEKEAKRHEAEQNLRKSEKVYRTIFETTGTATIIVEEDASIVLANKECEILSGFTREELEGGMRWTSFVAEDDLERMMNFHVARREDPLSAPSTYSFKFINRFGIVKHVYLKIALIPGTRRTVVSLLDVTPIMLMESALRESEDLFTRVFQSSPAIMAINTLPDGQFYEVNESFSRILGYAHDEVVGGAVRELSIWDDPNQWAGLLEHIKSCGAVHNLEIVFRKKSGEPFIGLTSLEVVTLRGEPYILSVASDITEIKRVENAMRESEASYRALAENLPGIVYRIFIQENMRMLFFNDMLEKMTGYKPGEIARGEVCSIDPLILPEDRGHVVEAVKLAIEKDQPFEVEYRLRHKDGTVRHFLERGRPRLGDNGEPLCIDGVILDITERKLLENSLRQTHRLEAIGTMAGGIAHDFNNILGVIIGYTEMALYDNPESSPFHFNLKQILRAGLRAKGIVQQILTFSRRQQKELERRPVDLGSVIEEALTLLRASLPSTIEIRRNIDNVSDMALADPGQMHQVLINLCNNAAHAMREKGGLLEVSLSEMQGDSSNAALYPELKPGAYLRLGVSDTGKGMDPAMLERIFDPYFTTKAVGEGSGLGLAVVQGIVKQHAGAIRVSSKPGKGAVFHIFIPIAESPQELVIDSRDHLRKGNARILIVDDEESLVDMASKMLQRLGYRVASKTSSVEALEVFRENPQEFDLVLTDYTMPHMTGIDLIRQLINIRSDIPVILCTGLDDITLNEEEMNKLGIGEFLRKPYTMQHIGEAIGRVLKGRK